MAELEGMIVAEPGILQPDGQKKRFCLKMEIFILLNMGNEIMLKKCFASLFVILRRWLVAGKYFFVFYPCTL